MSRSSFDRASLPPPRILYEQECGKLSRPSCGWARSRCPIHGGDNPTSFAVNLKTGGFYCHSCGARGGDVVAFVQQRYSKSFPEALKPFHIETDYQPKPRRREPPMSIERQLARKLAMAVEFGTESPADVW